MPRKPRFYVPDIPVHVIQRGHNRQAIFFEDNDYYSYLSWLKDASIRYECQIHAYVLMTNHVHLLATPKTSDGISRMMQSVGRKYVPYINHTYERSGTLWEGRYKGCLVDHEEYLFTCMRYIELNPVRAGMVSQPEEYRWSSYHSNGLGKQQSLVSPHRLYRSLANNKATRNERYKAMFAGQLGSDEIDMIRQSSQTGTPLGNDRFTDQIQAALGRKVGHRLRGRPKKGL